MHLRALPVFAALALGGSGSLIAQTPAAVDPELSYVTSGGAWERGDETGEYRVLVYSAGFEHVISQAFVQWVRGPDASGQPSRVVTTQPIRPINDQPTWSVGSPTLKARGANAATMVLEMENSHTEETARRVCTVQVGLPGKLTTRCRPQ